MKKFGLSIQMLMATVVGLIVGVILQLMHMEYIAKDIIAPIGTLFMNFVQMIIIPLIFCAVINGMRSLGDTRSYSQIGGKTVIIFLITTAIAASVGLAIGIVSGVGLGFEFDANSMTYEAPNRPGIIATIISFVPSNFFKALTDGNMVQIIIFSLALGASLMSIGKKAEPVYEVIDSLYQDVMKLTSVIMAWAPLGIFAIVTETFAVNGFGIIVPMIQLVALIYIGFAIHNFVVYGIGVQVFGKTSISDFYRKSFDAFLFGFTGQTSSAAIPFLEKACDRMGVPEYIRSFVIPLGSAIHKDGTALYQSVMVVFLANLFNIELSFGTMIMIVLAATIASVGTAGVPQGGMVTLSMVLMTAGVPIESISLVAGLISIIGMGSTLNNVAGDVATSLIVTTHENAFEAEPMREGSLVLDVK